MSEYIENPLDESNGNPFKVGDMVRVYGPFFEDGMADKGVYFKKITGRVDKIMHSDDLMVGIFHEPTGKTGTYLCNYRQCRLLTKKEPREFWIYIGAINSYEIKDEYRGFASKYCCPAALYAIEQPLDMEGWVHVKEVLDD